MNGKHAVKVLIVDDSASMRQLIRHSLTRYPEIEVVAEAASAREARDAVNRFNPDVMTLDVEMPGMDGLEFLERLMKARPMSVIMVSSLTKKGSDAAIRALSLGAIECIAKPSNGRLDEAFSSLGKTIILAAEARPRGQVSAHARPSPQAVAAKWNGKSVLIGASTGGVEALEVILSQFPENCPPTLVTQHMPAQFLVSFAARLNRLSAPLVKLATDGDLLEEGTVLIAPGGLTHLGLTGSNPVQVVLLEGPKQTGHRPSVDTMFLSALPYAKDIISVILTGMGADGAEGMYQLKKAGAFCIAQNQESCVVYGMPRVACEKGGVNISLDISDIAREVLARSSEGLTDSRSNGRSAHFAEH